MVIAPFIALIYGLGFALAVLTVGLLLTAFLAYDARDQVEPHRRITVMLMAGIALAFALLTGLAALSQFQ